MNTMKTVKWTLCLILSSTVFSSSVKAEGKVKVHGYLTQAYAVSARHQIFGIPTRGTTNYRTLAVQFRYDRDDENSLIFQLNNRRVGSSPLQRLDNDVALDWAYLIHYFGDQTYVKVGRIQMPFGIFNEIRDVGVLLPFFKLPYAPYGEGSYMSETIDGIAVTHSIYDLASWNLEFTAFAGRWEWTEWQRIASPIDGSDMDVMAKARVENAIGGQVWLWTPVEGLRFGSAFARGDINGGLNFEEGGLFGHRAVFFNTLSLDGAFRRFFARAEHLNLVLVGTDSRVKGYYAQVGAHLNERFSIHGQADFFKVNDVPVPDLFKPSTTAESATFDYNTDYALGLKALIHSHLVLKLEHHWNRGFLIEDAIPNPFADGTFKSRYAILSVSASF